MAYKLDLPPEMAIHPVFHVSLLRPYQGLDDVFTWRREHAPPPEVTAYGMMYEVGGILNDRSVSYERSTSSNGKGTGPIMIHASRSGTFTLRSCSPRTW